jgi:glycosyltransferase involved in cell wall biosynthesis
MVESTSTIDQFAPSPIQVDGRSLLISLITEGTYPFYDGGVSVWCDQLVRGLEAHQFRIDAVTTTGTEVPVWSLPSNVVELRTFPVWSVTVPPKPSVRCDPATKRALRALFDGFTAPIDAAQSCEHFRRLALFARDGRLAQSLMSDEAVDLVLSAMSHPVPDRVIGRPPSKPRVADAVASLRMLEHLLRPLTAPPAFAHLSHAASNGLGVLLAMTAKWEWGTPFLLTEHGLYLRERYIAYGPQSMPQHQRAFMLGFFRNLSAAAYHAADIVAPGSEYNRGWEIVSGADPSSIQPIYNGIHTPSFGVSDFEPADPTLAWVGRIDPLKDVKTLLRAFAVVRESIPNARLRIFGGTPRGNEGYHRECVALRDRLGLADCATFEGRVASIAEAYHAGHVVVSTSISEGFPYSVIEAMASGRAMVATDVGGVPEAVGDCGRIVAPRDQRAIARACVELLNDDALRRSLAQQGRERVLARFTLDLCLARYQTIYVSLADTADPPEMPVTRRIPSFAGGAA